MKSPLLRRGLPRLGRDDRGGLPTIGGPGREDRPRDLPEEGSTARGIRIGTRRLRVLAGEGGALAIDRTNRPSEGAKEPARAPYQVARVNLWVGLRVSDKVS
jgi:hypothetical protein